MLTVTAPMLVPLIKRSPLVRVPLATELVNVIAFAETLAFTEVVELIPLIAAAFARAEDCPLYVVMALVPKFDPTNALANPKVLAMPPAALYASAVAASFWAPRTRLVPPVASNIKRLVSNTRAVTFVIAAALIREARSVANAPLLVLVNVLRETSTVLIIREAVKRLPTRPVAPLRATERSAPQTATTDTWSSLSDVAKTSVALMLNSPEDKLPAPLVVGEAMPSPTLMALVANCPMAVARTSSISKVRV